MNPNQFNSNDQGYGNYNPYSNAINNELQKLQQSPTLLHRLATQNNSIPVNEQPISANAFENELKKSLQIGSSPRSPITVDAQVTSTTQAQPNTNIPPTQAGPPDPSNEDTKKTKQRNLSSVSPRKQPQSTGSATATIQFLSSEQKITTPEFTYTSTFGKGETESRQKVTSNTITQYHTDPIFNSGKMITTNTNYLLWGIRGGLLRAFHKFNCKNAIMKAHKQQITDIKIYHASQSNLVISASRDRSLILWEVDERKQQQQQQDGTSESTSSQKEPGLVYKVQLYVQPPVEQIHRFFKRVEWHPKRDAKILFAVTSINEVMRINIDTLLSNASLVNGTRICSFTNTTEGVTIIHESGNDVINDIRFSSDNGELLAAVTEGGKVILWNTTTLSKVYEQSLYPDESIPIWSIYFCGSKHRPNLYNSFITGTKNNTQFTLWKISDRNFNNDSNITKVQTVTIEPSSELTELSNITNTVELESSSSCLFVANLDTPTLFVIHIGDNNMDYIAELETNYPIVSFKSMTKFNDAEKSHVIGLFCLGTEAVQLVSVTVADNVSQTDSQLTTTQHAQSSSVEPLPAKTPSQTSPRSIATVSSSSQTCSPSITVTTSPANESADIRLLLKEMQKMEKRIITRMEETIEKHTQKQYDQLYHRLEREKLLRVKEERQKQEELLDTIAKAISQDIPNDVAAVIEERIVPAIVNELQGILQQALEKQFHSIGPVVEQSIVNSVRQPIQESFQHVLKATVIPSFQLSCQKMFTQISQTFDSGMEERIKKPLRDYYSALNQETIQIIDQHLKQFAIASVSHTSPTERLDAPLPHTITSQPTSQKDHISHLIKISRFDEAFTIALSSNDLKLVLWTCQNTTADKALAAISQPVLLSLIQQLAFDLRVQVDIKLDWIQKAILLLDPNDEIISMHAPPILHSVLLSLQRAFSIPENSDPQNPRSNKLKLLMHVVNSQLQGIKKD